MTVATEQAILSSGDSVFTLLNDRREFFPEFGDGGLSYERLLNAVRHAEAENALQGLADEITKVETNTELSLHQLKLRASALLLRDLKRQGWVIRVEREKIALYPATAQESSSPAAAKQTARQVGMFARQDQLSDPAVRRFITSLEAPGRGSAAIPITNLIADGRTLAAQLEPIAHLPKLKRGQELAKVIRPYLQLVELDKRCELTNIKLADIWRYFRFTWSLPYNTSPGRNLYFLIRDAGQPYHPVMAITALGNSVMQLTCRDQLLGWLPQDFIKLVDEGVITPDEAIAALQGCLEKSLNEIYIEDLPLEPEELHFPTAQTILRLLAFRDDAASRRHLELANDQRPKRIEFTSEVQPDELLRETKTTLYQFKRAKNLAELLRARMALNQKTDQLTSKEALQSLMANDEGKIAIGVALRQARNRLSGSAMMEIVVCGGVPPYSWLLSGKLACLLMLSPEVARIYEARYSEQISIIASQMAGRPIRRSATLVYLGTTSLYASGSSQYNRVVLPTGPLPRQIAEIRYEQLGVTQGYGSAHLSKETRFALTRLEHRKETFRRVNNVFGEGANPKMRQLAGGLSALGLGSADLLRHASPRLVYGIPLICNLERYLLEIDSRPEHIIRKNESDDGTADTEKIAEYWLHRWAASRLDHKPFFNQLGQSSPLKLRVSRDLPRPTGLQLEFGFMDSEIVQKDKQTIKADEKLEYIRRLYREESAFADNVKITQLREINILTPLEKVIETLIKREASVVLTGNAGDGKTHLIRLMEGKLEKLGAYIVQDASAEKLEEVVQRWSETLQSGTSSCIAINEGPLLDLIKQHRQEHPFLNDVERQLRQSLTYVQLTYVQSDNKTKAVGRKTWTPDADLRGQVFVIDLSLRRNLSRGMISAVLKKLTDARWYEGCSVCSNQASCGVTYNRNALSKPQVQERLGQLLESVAIRGEQITFRELMAFGSFLIFGERSCEELIELGESEDARYYSNCFEGGDGRLFDELRKGCDPVSNTHPVIDEGLWRGRFNPEEFPFDPKPIAQSFDMRVGKGNSIKAFEVFEPLKRRWYFEHSEGKRLAPRTEAESFLEQLQDAGQTTQARVSEILRLLNRFMYAGDRNYPDYLRLWTQLAFSPRNKSKAMVSGRQVSSQALFLYEPCLNPLLEKCFGMQPVDHLLLGPEGEDLRFANLRVDVKLLNLLLSLHGGIAEEPECIRRILRFNDTLANQVQPDGGDFRTVSMVENRTGREVRIRVDLRKRRYDGLDNNRM